MSEEDQESGSEDESEMSEKLSVNHINLQVSMSKNSR